MYDTILVGTDGSEQANTAVERAIDTAEAHGAELHAITVVNTSRYGEPALSSTELVLTELEDRGNEQLETVKELAQGRDIEVTTDCFHGEPSAELLRYADEIDADLIVLGSQGRTHPGSTIGSTADRVIRSTEREIILT
jgi:nucleotide-binding universal stress UspA family protein